MTHAEISRELSEHSRWFWDKETGPLYCKLMENPEKLERVRTLIEMTPGAECCDCRAEVPDGWRRCSRCFLRTLRGAL